MNLRRIFSPLIIVVCFSRATENQISHPIVHHIVIRGNQVTKEHIIRREIQHQVALPFDSLIAIEDRNRIDNLGIFSEVTFFLTQSDNGSNILTYLVVETWRYIPFPVIIYEERTGWSYGAGLTVNNFRGRNQIFQVLGAFGGTEFGGLFFHDPWITGDHISIQGHLFTTLYNHPFLKYDYREIDSEITVGRYFGYHWKVWVTGSLEKRWVSYVENVGEDFQHNYFQTKFKLIYDTRDIYLDPAKGILIFNEIRPEFGLGKTEPYNNIWETQISGYRTLIPGKKKWVLGGSLFFHKYFGKEIPYRIQWVGGTQSVRGWRTITPDDVEENYRVGLNSYYASFELRQTLVPKYLTSANTEFGVILAEFLDVGAADDKFFTMLKKEPIFGTGIGVRFFVPGGGLLRIDYGFGYYKGKWQSGTWHMDIGHKF